MAGTDNWTYEGKSVYQNERASIYALRYVISKLSAEHLWSGTCNLASASRQSPVDLDLYSEASWPDRRPLKLKNYDRKLQWELENAGFTGEVHELKRSI